MYVLDGKSRYAWPCVAMSLGGPPGADRWDRQVFPIFPNVLEQGDPLSDRCHCATTISLWRSDCTGTSLRSRYTARWDSLFELKTPRSAIPCRSPEISGAQGSLCVCSLGLLSDEVVLFRHPLHGELDTPGMSQGSFPTCPPYVLISPKSSRRYLLTR